MKRRNSVIFWILGSLLGLGLNTLAAVDRVSLDGDWDFTFKEGMVADLPALPANSEYDIQLRVPDYMVFQLDRLQKAKWWKHPINANVNYIGLRGIGFYRKTVDVPKDWAVRSVQLYVGRAFDRLNAWVNGKHVVFHPYSCVAPCRVEISPFLKPGEKNEIIIAVDNQQEYSGHYYLYGGITAPVYLQASQGPGSIASLYLRPGATLTDVCWKVELQGLASKRAMPAGRLAWLIRQVGATNILGRGTVDVQAFRGSATQEWSSSHKDLLPWHPNHPNLYMAELTWEQDGKVIDKLDQRFGLRRWQTDGRVLKINGQPIYLRQLYGCQHAATHWRYPQTKEYWRRYFEMIKVHGYNSVEWTEAPMPECLEAADEAGIVVQGNAIYPPYFAKRNQLIGKQTNLWMQVALWTRSYPSMSFYCLGGEMSYYEGFLDDVRQINQLIKSIHPESLFMANQSMDGIENHLGNVPAKDLLDEPFLHHPQRLKVLTEVSELFGSYPTGGTNNPMGGGLSYNPLDDPWQDINRRMALYQRPIITHEIVQSWRPWLFAEDGQFATFRYGRKPLDYLCNPSGWPPPGKSTIAYCMGVHVRNRVFYENIWRLHSIMTKHIFEKTRKCGNMIGFQDLGGQGGQHPLLLEPGPGYAGAAAFRRYNYENVLLLDWDGGNCLNRCYWEGDTFAGQAMASWYGEYPMTEGSLTWEIRDDDHILLRGYEPIGKVPGYSVSVLTNIAFAWPAVSRSKKLNLALHLSGNGLIVENDWDFWVFKRTPPGQIKAACSPALLPLLQSRYAGLQELQENSTDKLWIVDSLNSKAVRHLEDGRDVLLLGGKSLPRNSQWPKFNPGYRGHHNHGTVIHAHPLWQGFPQEGWGDWQFYPILQGAEPVIFQDKRASGGEMQGRVFTDWRVDLMEKAPFDPILEVGEISMQSRQACLFEWRVGKGRLLVSACSLVPDNPAGVALTDAMMAYVAGTNFAPKTAVSANWLRSLVSGMTGRNELRLSLSDFTGGTLAAKYNSSGNIPKDACFIKPQEVTRIAFDLDQAQMPVAAAGRLILWIDGQDADQIAIPPASVEIQLNQHVLFAGANPCVKRGWSTWEIPFEAQWALAGRNELTFRNLEPAGAKHKWFMFSDVRIMTPGAAGAKIPGITPGKPGDWVNQPVTIELKETKWFKLNQDEWREGERVTLAQEGTNLLLIKKQKNDQAVETINKKLDMTPPKLILISTPPIQQLAGEYFATPETQFAVGARDALSGVAKIEVAIDGAEFKPVAEPFALPAGKHEIRARCTDWAGNSMMTFTEGTEGGGPKDRIQVQIK